MSSGGSDIFITKMNAQGEFVWAKQIGSTEQDQADKIILDSSGNIFLAGRFTGSVDFDPGAGTANLTSGGLLDAFILKMNSNGDYLWAKGFGSASSLNDIAKSVAIDSSGNSYVTGYFKGTVDFDSGIGTSSFSSVGEIDFYVVKLDPSGNYLWAATAGSTGNDLAAAITIDNSGHILITGYFTGPVDFDPGAGIANLIAAGSNDSFILKLDSLGQLIWAKQIGGTLGEGGNAVVTDSSGNVLTTGFFAGTVDFDPGAGDSSLMSRGSNDFYISKLDQSGNFVWAKTIGSTSVDESLGISLDGNENVITTGYFTGTVDFDPGAGTANLVSGGAFDSFVLKLAPSGQFIWAKKIGGASNDNGWGVVTDSNGNIYTTGYFQGTADFDPNDGVSNLINTLGVQDIYILKLNAAGELSLADSPDSPALNSITAGDRRITITFTAGSNNGAAITDFEYSLNGGSYISAGTTASPFTISGLSGRTSYSVTLKARNSAGLSSASGALSATTTDSLLDASEAAAAAKKAKEQKALTELLSVIPSIAGLALNIGDLTNSLLSTKCVKGKTIKHVKKGAKCPKGYKKAAR